ATLTHAQLSGADLTDAVLRNANVSYAQLAACFFDVNGGRCILAIATGADLRSANLFNTITSSCGSLDFGDGIGTIFVCGGVSMTNTAMVGTNLFGTDLSRTDLTHANLTRAKFASNTFSGCISDHIAGDLSSAANSSD